MATTEEQREERRWGKASRREYPYETKALLGYPERYVPVTVLKSPIDSHFDNRGKRHGMHTILVQVHGEEAPRRISVQRLEEEP